MLRRAATTRRDLVGVRASRPASRRVFLEILEARTLLTTSDPLAGFLTGPNPGAPLDIAKDYLARNGSAFGFAAGDADRAFVTDQYTDRSTGITHIYMTQGLDGIRVENAQISIHVGPLGQVLFAGGDFVPGLGKGPSAPAPPAPAITASQAILSAASQLGLDGNGATPVVAAAPAGTDQTGAYSFPAIAAQDIPVHLAYVNTPLGVREAWSINIKTNPLPEFHWYDLSVDAATGQILDQNDWVDHLSDGSKLNVYDLPKISPLDGDRTVLTDPSDPLASPFGWFDRNGAAGPDTTDTNGANVNAYLDLGAAGNGIGPRPDGGTALNFDFPLNLALEPSTYYDASTTNLFYLVNMNHDVLYHYGFDEKAGNFQLNNYGRGGLGGDAVNAAEAYGASTGLFNNAFMATPPDGQAPLLAGFLNNLNVINGNAISPVRSSSLESQTIMHEVNHGTSNRLTGGPADANALSAIQSGGMGEGWSDWFALMYAQVASDSLTTSRPIFNYTTGFDNSGPGLRTFPYSYDLRIDPRTIVGFNTNGEVHDTGEIWCAALWDMNLLLTAKYGFDPDLAGGYTGEDSGGNELAIQLVIDGMKLQPAKPSFTDARNAILAADQSLTGGANQFEIWSAFARRGMGLSFNAGANSSATTVVPATDLPQFLTITAAALPKFTEATTLTGATIATLSDPAGDGSTSAYSATIDWGDNTASTASIVPKPGTDKTLFNVVASHTYLVGGTYKVKITATQSTQSGTLTAKASATATVGGLPIRVTPGVPIAPAGGEGTPYSGTLVSFTDDANAALAGLSPPQAPRAASFYAAKVAYPNGVVNAGTIRPNASGGYDVLDESGYRLGGGKYLVSVTITKPGLSASGSVAADVADSILTSRGQSINPVEGQPFRGAVASFTDADPRFPGASNYFATIKWGDGTSSRGTIAPNPVAPGFIVTGDHAYDVGSYPNLTVDIGNLSGLNTTTATSSAVVADAPLASQGYNIQATAGAPFSGILATFQDSDPRPHAIGHYQASIDWGDGTVGVGQVVVNEDGGYIVKGSHAFRPGNFGIRTTISDVGDSTTAATSAAAVPDSPIVLTFNPGLTLGQGVAQTLDIARFTTVNTLALAGDYTATIDYGDGTQGAGIVILTGVSPTALTFDVTMNRLYTRVGTVPVSVTVAGPGGGQVKQVGTIAVNAAPVAASPLAVSGTSKTPLSNLLVAAFATPNPTAQPGDYVATISWGDRTSSVGTIRRSASGGFQVVGDHTFPEGGTFPVTVTIAATGVSATVTGSAAIGDLLTPIVGGASGTPVSGSALTNASQPIFQGTAEPNATVTIFAQTAGGSSVAVGSGKADPTGQFTIVSTPLSDGQYSVSASATDAAGRASSSLTTLYPAAARGLLTVDTQGPKVTASSLNPRTGKVTIHFADGLSGLGSGVLVAGNYSLRSSTGQSFAATSLTAAPEGNGTGDAVTLTFASARPLKKGTYVLALNSAGLTDRAGNALDERYFVPFPGTYSQPGQNYIAAFQTDGKTASPPRQYVPPVEVVAAKKHKLFVRNHFRRR